ncbi:MAG: sigma-70 family RNA polymerase sigma factor, partial [Flavobacteriaceae bacterium]|nr:sigma-70 family RNA polymerase sigma factor [Flavobacteriaceae bacterium]
DVYLEEEKSDVLYRALSHLNKMEKALVFLYLEGKNYKEIAETLNITEVNARVKMNRIKTKLQEQINSNPNL